MSTELVRTKRYSASECRPSVVTRHARRNNQHDIRLIVGSLLIGVPMRRHLRHEGINFAWSISSSTPKLKSDRIGPGSHLGTSADLQVPPSLMPDKLGLRYSRDE